MKRLEPGQIVYIGTEPHRVVRVTDCSAVIEPVNTRQVKIQTRFGEEVQFEARRPVKRISAHSEVVS